MRLRYLVFSLATVGLVAVSPAIVRRHDVPDASYISLGNSGPATSVGMATGNVIGSATYIGFGNGFHWALTAGHVSTENITNINFGFGNIAVNGRFTMGGYNPGTLANDLGLLRFSSSPGVVAIPYSNTNTYTGFDAMYVGYGRNGDGNSGAGGLDGQRRAAMNRIDGFDVNFWQTTFNTPAQGALPMEGTTAPGDSGGAFMVNDGGWKLIGVVSWGTEPNSIYGDIAFNTTLHNRVSFIQGTSGIAPGVPEPASMVALGLGVLALARRRRNN